MRALTLFLLFCGGVANCQDRDARFLRLTYANDYFTATDYYYTQGIRLEYGVGSRVYGVGQEGYTPTSIRAEHILTGDRPYAGALYFIYQTGQAPAGRGSGTAWEKPWTMEILAGVTGPPSLAEAEQKWIHRQTGNVEPRGWQHQIVTDVVLDYSVRYSTSLATRRYVQWNVEAEGRVGTYRTRLGLASLLRLGYLPTRHRRFGISVHLRPAARLVGYDASMQGGLFNRTSPYTIKSRDLRRLVGEASVGLELQVAGQRLTFAQTYLSREFRRGRPHAWGTVVLQTTW